MKVYFSRLSLKDGLSVKDPMVQELLEMMKMYEDRFLIKGDEALKQNLENIQDVLLGFENDPLFADYAPIEMVRMDGQNKDEFRLLFHRPDTDPLHDTPNVLCSIHFYVVRGECSYSKSEFGNYWIYSKGEACHD